MSSKRRLRRKQCERKRRYEDNHTARVALGRMFARGKIDGKMSVYHCKRCGGYHIGHSFGLNHGA